jgi:hypothetical protein
MLRIDSRAPQIRAQLSQRFLSTLDSRPRYIKEDTKLKTTLLQTLARFCARVLKL